MKYRHFIQFLSALGLCFICLKLTLTKSIKMAAYRYIQEVNNASIISYWCKYVDDCSYLDKYAESCAYLHKYICNYYSHFERFFAYFHRYFQPILERLAWYDRFSFDNKSWLIIRRRGALINKREYSQQGFLLIVGRRCLSKAFYHWFWFFAIFFSPWEISQYFSQ